MTGTDFARSMAKLGAAYRKDFSSATTEVYYEALGQLAPHDLDAAVRWAIASSKFMPAPAELLDRAKHERNARLRALPPEDVPAIPEWVTEGEVADVPALIAELLPKLTLAHKRVKALRPDQTPGAEVDLDQDALAARVAKANAMLQAFHAHNAKEPS